MKKKLRQKKVFCIDFFRVKNKGRDANGEGKGKRRFQGRFGGTRTKLEETSMALVRTS